LAGHQEITGLAFDPTANRLAVCNRGGGVQLFSLTAQIMPVAIVLHTIADCVPRALAFAERQGPERDLLVFGLYCGYV
jgi:hypothetical protein